MFLKKGLTFSIQLSRSVWRASNSRLDSPALVSFEFNLEESYARVDIVAETDLVAVEVTGMMPVVKLKIGGIVVERLVGHQALARYF